MWALESGLLWVRDQGRGAAGGCTASSHGSSCAVGRPEPCPQSSCRTALSLPEPDHLRPYGLGHGGREELTGCCVKLCRLPFRGAPRVLLVRGTVGPWPGDVAGSHVRATRSGLYESGSVRNTSSR